MLNVLDIKIFGIDSQTHCYTLVQRSMGDAGLNIHFCILDLVLFRDMMAQLPVS